MFSNGLEIVENELLIPRIALEYQSEDAAFVKYNPGMFTYDPCREVLVMKPWAVSAGLRAIAKGRA